MAQCLLVFEEDRKYHRIPDAEVEDWDEVLEELDAEPHLIERVEGWAPYTHAYRLPDGSVYLVALGGGRGRRRLVEKIARNPIAFSRHRNSR